MFTRNLVIKSHRYLGLALAGFLIVSGITGSVIAFEKELEIWLNPELFTISESGERALPASELVARVEAADSAIRITYLPIVSVATHALVLYVEPKKNPVTGQPYAIDYDELFVNPVSGEITGKRFWGACCFERDNIIPLLYKLHNRLLLPKPWGSRLLGGVALLWLVMIGLGIYLTLPPGKHRLSRWKSAWKLRKGLPGLVKITQLHRTFGLWLSLMMLSMAVTAVSLNLERELFKPLLNALSPLSPTVWEKIEKHPPKAQGTSLLSFAEVLAQAQSAARSQGIESAPSAITAYYDEAVFAVSFGEGLAVGPDPLKLYMDGYNGRQIALSQGKDDRLGNRIMGLRHAVHSGQVAGIYGRLLVALLGLMTAMISILGVTIWWRKRGTQQRR